MGNICACISNEPYQVCNSCRMYRKKYKMFYWNDVYFCDACVPDAYFKQDMVPLMKQNSGHVTGRYMF